METPSQNTWYSMDNPLLEGLPGFNGLDDFVEKLAFDPLEGIDLSKLDIMARLPLLVGEKTPLEPTILSIRTAMTLWGMFIGGLKARNPYFPDAIRHYWSLINAAACGDETPFKSPTQGISLLVIKGPTGTGKTVTIQRFLKLLPKTIKRSENNRAGWKELEQLIYVECMVPPDGSRGGIVDGILRGMDTMLGTNYSQELKKANRTVENLLLATIGKLVAHYTGLVLVDEGQLRNLVKSGQAGAMQTFLLMLMNIGIPIVLIGNERAFDWVTYSQDKSRLNINPPEIFAPAGAIDRLESESEWESIATGVMKYYVLLKPISDLAECSRVLWRCSGGIPRLALTLWCTAQRKALFSGRETICSKDINLAYEDRGFDDLRPLADGFSLRKPELRIGFEDVDYQYYAKQWGANLPQSEHNNVSNTSISVNVTKSNARKTGKQKFKSEKTRKLNQQKKRDELSKNLSPEDVRRQGLINIGLEGLESLRNKSKEK
jgi:hypothetical protein